MCDHHDHDHEHSHAHSHGDHEHDHPHSHDGDGDHADHEGGDHDHSHDGDHEHERDATHEHSHDTDAVDADAGIDTDGTLRVAVTGKGGVGKTTLSAAIADALASDPSRDVIALDADPDMNLASALGVPEPPAITDQEGLIEDRAGSGGGLISLAPDVDDVLDSHATPFGEGGRLLTIGAPAGGNTGCMCPENSFVRSLVRSALDVDHLVMDMEAGVEHLGRGTADEVDVMLVVVEPSMASIETARRVSELAADLGIPEVRAVLNQSQGNADRVINQLDVPVIATMGTDEDVAEAALTGESPVEASPRLREVAARIVDSFGGGAIA